MVVNSCILVNRYHIGDPYTDHSDDPNTAHIGDPYAFR